MNSLIGAGLVAAALAVGWRAYGWQGVLLAVTITVFWLLLQFSRALRAMKNAGRAPVGEVASAVMLNAKLQRGMTMLKVIGLTHSLGAKVDGAGGGDDVWRWRDGGGSHVTLAFGGGKLANWTLWRPPESTAAPTPAAPLPADPRP